MKAIKAITALLVFVFLGYYLGFRKGERHASSSFSEEVVRNTYTDTIPFYFPVPRDSVVLRFETVKLPVAADNRNDNPSTPAAADSLPEKTTADVIIPIEQKVYRDSSFTAYVSGFRPSLDSLVLHPRVETIVINRRMKPKRWCIGLQAGYGLGLQKPKLTPYIGIGISYNLFSF